MKPSLLATTNETEARATKMLNFKAGQLRPVLETVPEEPEPAQQAPRRRMEPRPAAVQYENRHSLIPVVRDLDASLPPSWRPPSPPSQSFFDWSDDELEPPAKPRRRRKSSKSRDSAEEHSAGARDSQGSRKASHSFSDHSATNHGVDDSLGSSFSKHSSAESKKSDIDRRSSSETAAAAKNSLVRAVKSLKNLRNPASKSTSSLVNTTTSTASLSTSDLTTSATTTHTSPPIPPLPAQHNAAVSLSSLDRDEFQRPSVGSDIDNSTVSTFPQQRQNTPNSQPTTGERVPEESLPRMLPMMGSFLGSPTVFFASPSPKHRQGSALPTSPTSSIFRVPGTPSSLPRSASSPGGAFTPSGLGRKLRRHFSSQTQESENSASTDQSAQKASIAQQSSLQGPIAHLPMSKAKKRRARMRVNDGLFESAIIVDSARELTAVLIERGRALGLTPVRPVTELNDHEVEYIAQNYRDSRKASIQNYLFEVEPITDKLQDHSASTTSQSDQPFGLGIAASSSSLYPADSTDAASIYSSISAGKIDKALGPDYNPHLSTFGLDAVHYLDELRRKKAMEPVESDAGSTPTLRASELNVKAKRSSLDPAKIKMTPELQQELFTASLTRAEQLKHMPEHPYLRDEPVSKMSFDSSDDGRPETDTTETAKRIISPVEGQIDELLATLELQKQTSPGPAALQTQDGNRLSETQQIRQEFGLALLRRPRADTQKHSKHIFDWHTEKLMCRSIHNPMEILPELPAFDPTREVSMKEFDQHFFENINAAEYKAPIKCASPVCDQYCCHYGKLVVNSMSYQGDILSYSRAMKCMEDANKIKNCKPNGVEEWDSFLKCTFCLKIYCPSCIKLCAQPICQQPFCIFCSDGKADCEDHEGVL